MAPFGTLFFSFCSVRGPFPRSNVPASRFTAADGGFSGELKTETVAARLNPFGGRRGGAGGEAPPPPADAKGTAKFWIKDGVLSKLEYHVTGVINFNGDDRDVDRTTTIEIKDVGKTKLENEDGKWRVAFHSFATQFAQQNWMIQAANETADEIRAGKYPTGAAARAAFDKREPAR